jgi:hypothetical protein
LYLFNTYSCVTQIALYGTKTWPLRKIEERRIDGNVKEEVVRKMNGENYTTMKM